MNFDKTLRHVLVLACTLIISANSPLLAGKGGGGHGASTGSAGSPGKSVYVHGYTRADGTYVAPHYRSAPGAGGGLPSDGKMRILGEDPVMPVTAAAIPAQPPTRTPAPARAKPVHVRVFVDPLTKLYYRGSASAAASLRSLDRSAAIAGGYRPGECGKGRLR